MKAKVHSLQEKLHLRRKKRKLGPAALRRKAARIHLQPKPQVVAESVAV